MKFSAFPVVTGLLIVSGHLSGQQPSVRHAVAAAPFACGQDTFGPGFAGANIETVIKRIKASPAAQPKSEFETTEQYKRRTHGSGESLVFVLPKDSSKLTDSLHKVGDGVYYDIHYDADTATMTIGIENDFRQVEDSKPEDYLKIASKDWVQPKQFLAFNLIRHASYGPKYVGSNSFGVKASVTSQDNTVYGLAFTLPKDPDPDDYHSVYGQSPANAYGNALIAAHEARDRMSVMGGPVIIGMTPQQAQAIKPFLRLAVVAQIQPHVYEVEDFFGPSLDAPRAVWNHKKYLDMTIERLVAFDSRTGKILKMQPGCESSADNQANNAEKEPGQPISSRQRPGEQQPESISKLPSGADAGNVGAAVGSIVGSLQSSQPAENEGTGRPTSAIQVGGNVQAANLIRQTRPAYPPLAKQARIQGTVRFNAVIAKDGTIETLTVVSGHPMLIQAAREAVNQWQYKPTLLNGEPVEVLTTIDVNFPPNR
jgi:TonB family protein